MNVIHRDPRDFGYRKSRWTLDLIARCCTWLRVTTEGSVSGLLKRLGIRYKRGRQSLHSPDRGYDRKVHRLEMRRFRAKYDPERYVFLYLDEFSYYRQPLVARAYAQTGSHQVVARMSHQSNTRFRVIAAMNAVTGQVTAQQYSKINLHNLSRFYALIAQTYPQAETIYLAVDNWPVHFHVDVLARLEPQNFADDFNVPDNWPTQPTGRAIHDNLPIQLVPLPTYAPWLNPIEKLWRWLSQDVLALHRLADDWQTLKHYVQDFLSQFQDGSNDLLHYVGLLPY